MALFYYDFTFPMNLWTSSKNAPKNFDTSHTNKFCIHRIYWVWLYSLSTSNRNKTPGCIIPCILQNAVKSMLPCSIFAPNRYRKDASKEYNHMWPILVINYQIHCWPKTSLVCWQTLPLNLHSKKFHKLDNKNHVYTLHYTLYTQAILQSTWKWHKLKKIYYKKMIHFSSCG